MKSNSLFLFVPCLLFILLTSTINTTYGGKILFLLPIASKSHQNVFDPLIQALADKGHQISVVAPSKSKSHPNVKQVVPAASTDFLHMFPDPFDLRRAGKLTGMFFDLSNIFNICHKVFEDPEFQEITSTNQNYDLVLMPAFLNNCFDGIIYKLKAPHIIVSTVAAPSFITQLTGNFLPLSFVPAVFLDLSDSMSFSERFLNTAIEYVMKIISHVYYLPKLEAIYRQHLGSNYPSYFEIHANVSLILMNSYFSLTYPRPNMPDNIEVGGMHCRPAQPLPKELDEFLSGAKHGFIYFSLGSIVQAKNMPEETRKKFIQIFSKLKQRIIWKWESNMTDLPSNVRINKWLPQQDVLGHPNIRAFITHGGLLSTQEAIYHGVPLLGMPVFADQDLNMKHAASQGYALTSEILDLDAKDLEDKLNRVLHEPQFYEKAKYLSSIFRDQMQTPIERAVYWSEYVINHKGAPQLRSAARNLNYLQAKSVDVVGLLVALILIMFSIFIYSCKVLRKCFRCKTTKKSQQQQESKMKFKKNK